MGDNGRMEINRVCTENRERLLCPNGPEPEMAGERGDVPVPVCMRAVMRSARCVGHGRRLSGTTDSGWNEVTTVTDNPGCSVQMYIRGVNEVPGHVV